MKQYRYVVTIGLNDDTGTDIQSVKLMGKIRSLLLEEDLHAELLEGGFNYITNINVDFPSVSKERLEKETDYYKNT